MSIVTSTANVFDGGLCTSDIARLPLQGFFTVEREVAQHTVAILSE